MAPVSRLAKIEDWPTCPAGLNHDSTNINATASNVKREPEDQRRAAPLLRVVL